MLLEPLEKCKTDRPGAILLLQGADGGLIAHVAAGDPGLERDLLRLLDDYCLARIDAAVRRPDRVPAPAAMACSCGGPCRDGGR